MKVLYPLLLATLLAACSADTGPGSSKVALVDPPDGPLVALVNGEAITEPVLVVFAKGRDLDPALPEQRQRALDSLIENVLLAQRAQASGLLDKPEFKAEAAIIRLQYAAGRALGDYRDNLVIDDAQIQALYEEERRRAGETEWLVQHLLFADQGSAELALQRARAEAADFAALIQEYAAGGSRQARELPWSNATQLPAELVTVLNQLEDGEVAPLVVQTSFGFHVVRRVQSRPFQAPDLDSIRDGARRQLTERALKEFMAGLRASGDVSVGVGAGSPGG